MERLGLHLELPVDGVPRLDTAREYGALQLLYGLYRPVLSASPGSAYGLCTIDAVEDERLVLRVREDSIWHSGSEVRADQIARSLARWTSERPGLAGLLGLGPDGIETIDGRRLRLSTHAPTLARVLLSDVTLAPSRVDDSGTRDYHGVLRPMPDGTYTLVDGSGVVEPRVIPKASDAVRAFDDGSLVATCPAAFDVATLVPEGRLHSEITNMWAVVHINPNRVPGLRSIHDRAAVLADLDLQGQLAAIGAAASYPLQLAPLARSDLRGTDCAILYGHYWPNAIIANAVSEALVRRGADRVRAVPLPLEQLVERLDAGDYALALAILPGSWGRLSLLLGWAARVYRGCDPADRVRVTELARSWDLLDGLGHQRLEAFVLARTHALPLLRFRSGHLARGGLREAALAGGAYLPLEYLTRGGS